MKTIGDNIVTARLSLNMSQAELAEQLGVSHAQISFYENNKNIPSAIILKELSRVLKKPKDIDIMEQKIKKLKNSLNIVSSPNSLESRQRVPKKQYRAIRTVNGINIQLMQDNHDEIVYIDGEKKKR